MATRCKNKNGLVVSTIFKQIKDHEKGLTCIDCGGEMFTRFGRSGYSDHVVHKSGKECSQTYSNYEPTTHVHETVQHYFAKAFDAQLEKVFRDREGKVKNRADVFLNNHVIEIQNSSLSIEKRNQREASYGKELSWILTRENLDAELVRSEDDYYFFSFDFKSFKKWKESERPIYLLYKPGDLWKANSTHWLDTFYGSIDKFGNLPLYRVVLYCPNVANKDFAYIQAILRSLGTLPDTLLSAKRAYLVAERITLRQLGTEITTNKHQTEPFENLYQVMSLIRRDWDLERERRELERQRRAREEKKQRDEQMRFWQEEQKRLRGQRELELELKRQERIRQLELEEDYQTYR